MTWLTERFDLSVPVVSAPMAGVASGELAAAVSQAGALGMVGVGNSATAGWIAEQARRAAGGDRPFGVGLTAWAVQQHPEQLEVVSTCGASLVSVSFGDYFRFVQPLRDAGVTVATQIGTAAEAVQAEQAGVDVIVARGGEGGGHGRNDVATLPLLQAVVEVVQIPVLAAGGIATARGLAAVLAAGAAGAWVGTAFTACHESDSSPAAREQLVQASASDTVYGRVFDIAQGLGWPPQYGGRSLRNAFLDRWAGREDELANDPAAARQLADAKEHEDFDTACIYAGQGVGQLRRVGHAANVVAEFARANELLLEA